MDVRQSKLPWETAFQKLAIVFHSRGSGQAFFEGQCEVNTFSNGYGSSYFEHFLRLLFSCFIF